MQNAESLYFLILRSAFCIQIAKIMFTLTLDDFKTVRSRIGQHIKHTPLLTSRQLSEATGFEAGICWRGGARHNKEKIFMSRAACCSLASSVEPMEKTWDQR